MLRVALCPQCRAPGSPTLWVDVARGMVPAEPWWVAGDRGAEIDVPAPLILGETACGFVPAVPGPRLPHAVGRRCERHGARRAGGFYFPPPEGVDGRSANCASLRGHRRWGGPCRLHIPTNCVGTRIFSCLYRCWWGTIFFCDNSAAAITYPPPPTPPPSVSRSPVKVPASTSSGGVPHTCAFFRA